jgi:hypothetical protein
MELLPAKGRKSIVCGYSATGLPLPLAPPTVQMFAGVGLGFAAQALLAWNLIFHLMPSIGLDLLDMARAVADFDLPTRVAQLVAGSF